MQTKDNKKVKFGLTNDLGDIRKASSLLAMAKGILEDTLVLNEDYFYQNDSTYNHQCDIQDAFEVIDSIEGDLDTLCEKLENES